MASELSPAIEAIWERSRPEIAGQIATLEEAAAALLAGDLAEELRGRAERDAHKLAGSLGMFGVPTGSELAREVEQALGAGGGSAGRDVTWIAAWVRALRVEFELRSRPARSGELPAPGKAQVRATPTILVIDDSPLIRGVVQAELGGKRGWRVVAAGSGAEGLELAANEAPDAILLDVEMPGLDGPETLAHLRRHASARAIPVLFLTGHGTAEDRAALESLGATGVIAKPFEPASLASQVGRLLSWAA